MTDELTKESLDELNLNFGDVVENGWASDVNPKKRGYFIRYATRQRQKCAEITDGKGKIWHCPLKNHRLSKVADSSLARAHLEARESGEGLVETLRDTTEEMANRCSVDQFLWQRHSRAALDAADALAAMKAELNKWKQPYVHCFTCGAPAHKVIHLPDGCAALPDVSGIVGICPQHEYSIEPHEPYHVLCDFSATTPDQLAAMKAENERLWAALNEAERSNNHLRAALGKGTP